MTRSEKLMKIENRASICARVFRSGIRNVTTLLENILRTQDTESDILAPPFLRRTIWRRRFGARTFGRRTVGRQENLAPENWARECKEQDHEIIDYLHEIFQRLWVRPALRTPKSSVK